MKRLFPYILSGIIGGLLVVGFLKMTDDPSGYSRPYNVRPTLVSTHSVSGLPSDFVKASKKATPAVVNITAKESIALAQKRRRRDPFGDFFGRDFFEQFYGPRQTEGTGSGVIISPDGYIVTNNHVVGFADEIMVTLADGRKMNAKKIGTDPSTDLAVIKIDVDQKLPTLKFGDSDRVQVGEWILAVGNPFSYLTSTVTAGIVSAKGRNLGIIKGRKAIEDFIQTDAAINPGNSGGALVNLDGDLIGINTAIATPTGVFAGYSFAIPAKVAKRVVKDIIAGGDIERTNLGILGYDVDNAFQKDLNLSVNYGFYIDNVEKGSTAHLSGLLPGDVIVEINGAKVNKFEDIDKQMKFNKVGDVVNMVVIRDGVKKKLDVVLRKRKLVGN